MSARVLDDLRGRIRRLERPTGRPAGALPFGIPAIDQALPAQGLERGTLHEIAGGGADEVAGACAALFTAGILARLPHSILWCGTARDLFAPGLACAGLLPHRVLHAEAPDDTTVLLVMEEALRHPGLSAVVGELTSLPMTASRRLVLAAEKSGVTALALRRRREGKAEKSGLTAACTRWRVTPLPSPPPLPGQHSGGLDRARWRIELTRCRGGQPDSWIMEACDAQGCLAVPADLADRPAGQTGQAWAGLHAG
jgi:protein ImuA